MKKHILAIFGFALLAILALVPIANTYQLDSWKPIIPIIAVFIGIIPNIIYINYRELEKRKFELYKMRESTYGELIKGMRGFYIDGKTEQRELFLHALRIAWLYCPDHVIKKPMYYWIYVTMLTNNVNLAWGKKYLGNSY